MLSTVKEIIRDIKLYELGIKGKLDGYDTLMSLRDLNPHKVESNIIHYGETIDDIKFKYYNHRRGYIFLKYETWKSIEYSFKLSHNEVKELTMWSIGSDYNLEGVPTSIDWSTT